jgi:hypothetical protein
LLDGHSAANPRLHPIYPGGLFAPSRREDRARIERDGGPAKTDSPLSARANGDRLSGPAIIEGCCHQKELFLIDLNGAQDVTSVTGPDANLSAYAVSKTLFLDIVAKLNDAGSQPKLLAVGRIHLAVV